MQERMRMSAAVGLLVILWSGALVVAEEGRTAHRGEGWDFMIAPYLWMAGVDGDVSLGATAASGSVDFGDVLNNLDAGGSAYFSARKDKRGIYVDATFMEVSAPVTVAGGAATTAARMQLYEVGGLYRMYEGYAGADGLPVSTDLFFGGRFVSLDASVQPAVGVKAQGSESWFDPIIGASHHRDFTKKFTISTSGDFGGLGIGSDFTWSLRVMGGYRMTDHTNVWFGYRYLDIDYDHGRGTGKFVYDVALHGPILGASFHF